MSKQLPLMDWLVLGEALDGLIQRRLAWHNDRGEYGCVRAGVSYPEEWFRRVP